MASKQLQSKVSSRDRSRRASSASSRTSISSDNNLNIGLKSPILGENFFIPDLYSELQNIELDDTSPYIPVYCHFIVPEIEPITRPKTPPILTALRAELGEMQLTKATRTRPEQKSRNPQHNNYRQSNKNH